MATRRERIQYQLDAQDNASRVFRGVEGSAKRLQGAYQGVSQAIGILAGGAFIRAVTRATVESEQSQNRLTAALRATGDRIGITRGQLDELASSMAEATQFDDEGIRNAQAQLVKFGNIQGDVFRGALKISADLSAFMGTDLATAASNVGRALSAPIQGLENLQTYIGRVTEKEKEHIETLAQQGRAVEAQNAVLKILQDRIGGTAEIMNSGLTRSTKELSKSWDDMLKTIGNTDVFKDAVGGAASLFRDLAREIQGVDTPLRALVGMSSRSGDAFAGGRTPGAVSGKITDAQGRPVTLGGRKPAGVTLLGKTGTEEERRRMQELQDVQSAFRSQLAADREAEFNNPEALEKALEGLLPTPEQLQAALDQQDKQLADYYQRKADREAEFNSPQALEAQLNDRNTILEREYKNQIALLAQLRDEGLYTQEEYNDREREITFDHQRQITGMMQFQLTEREKFQRMSMRKQVETVLDSYESMTQAGATQSKKWFKINQALAASNAAVKGYEAVNSAIAWASSWGGYPAGIAAGALMAAAVGAQITAILSQEFGGSTAVGTFSASAATGLPTSQAAAAPRGPDTILRVSSTSIFTGQALAELFDRANEFVKDGGRIRVEATR